MLYLQLSRQALQQRRVCLRNLLQPVGEQSVEHAEVGRQAGAQVGHLIFMACLQDALDGIVEDQAVAVLLAQAVDELPACPASTHWAMRYRPASGASARICSSCMPELLSDRHATGSQL